MLGEEKEYTYCSQAIGEDPGLFGAYLEGDFGFLFEKLRKVRAQRAKGEGKGRKQREKTKGENKGRKQREKTKGENKGRKQREIKKERTAQMCTPLCIPIFCKNLKHT
ncbi:conserved hypothetical protein [Plasmodium ovale wallikeri]|uniref:Uncharacterized protein n=1 Tax=Plasmodium ovale wallikeri TaxID=864142 RepID=A0A1A8YLA5_PLAOA|nr:conserved hypothetical protein [Plasmodium ovale wallikeri]SBT32344.1 conserved hypothetical protein [Plasmodium ovale wallikeri]